MVGLIGIIFVFLPETAWWLAGKGKLDKAEKVLRLCYGEENYDIHEQIVTSRPLTFPYPLLTWSQEVMTATIAMERQSAEENKELGTWAVFQGRNLLRFIICAWPKITQQFVGLAVFNSNATYFCMLTTLNAF